MSNVAYANFAAHSAARSNRMENQKTGFIPLYRSVLKQPWSRDVFLRTLWDNLLLSAARQPYTANFKGRQWPLQTGQLVTTSADLGLNLCDREGKPCSRHAVDRMLDVFEREGMISRSGEKRKGSVITITNYAEYAQKMDDLPAHYPAQISELKPARMTMPVTARLRKVMPRIQASIAASVSPRIMNNKVITTIKTLKDLRRRILANPPTTLQKNFFPDIPKRQGGSTRQPVNPGELPKTCWLPAGFTIVCWWLTPASLSPGGLNGLTPSA